MFVIQASTALLNAGFIVFSYSFPSFVKVESVGHV